MEGPCHLLQDCVRNLVGQASGRLPFNVLSHTKDERQQVEVWDINSRIRWVVVDLGHGC